MKAQSLAHKWRLTCSLALGALAPSPNSAHQVEVGSPVPVWARAEPGEHLSGPSNTVQCPKEEGEGQPHSQAAVGLWPSLLGHQELAPDQCQGCSFK